MILLTLNFYKLAFGNVITNISGILYTIVATSFIYEYTKSATLAAIVALVRTIAKIISGLQLLFYTERFEITRLISSFYLFQVLLLSFFIVYFKLIELNTFTTTFIYLFVFFISYIEGIILPCRNSLVPKVVTHTQLFRANNIISFLEQTVSLLSWGMGGLLVVYFDKLWILVGITFSYLFPALLFKSMNIKIDKMKHKKKKIFRLDGWRVVKSNPFLLKMLIVDIIEGIASGIWIGGITLAFVREVLHKGENWWGYINTSYYLGTILSSSVLIIISSIIRRKLVISMSLGSLGVSVFVFIFGLNKIPLMSLVLVFVLGLFYQLRDSAQRTLLQLHVKDDDLTAFYGFYSSINSVVFGFSIFLMGTISDLLGPQNIYLLASLMTLVSSILIFVALKNLKIEFNVNKTI